ncbi:MAG: hypothetical protein DRG50_04910 [Deltaproteobacteria bacterium]|nr:MAG: hypothetical protein DRG50_04910 [Deltaproteobacteria bacterium]
MPRPTKWRCVGYMPQVNFFMPAGVSLPLLEEICLSVEEVEAIRLRDLEGLDQERCAQKMRVSRTTFHRILGSARKKLADALFNGKAFRIEGGNFELALRRFRCNHDGYEWQVSFDTMITNPPRDCPNCHSTDIVSLPPFKYGWSNGRR